MVAIAVGGCNRKPAINGEFNVTYDWVDGAVQSSVVQAVKPQGPVPDSARRVILDIVKLYIADGVQAANLKRASGRIDAVIYSPPPYYVQPREFVITEPDFSALTAAVEKEDTAAIRKMIASFQNVNQRDLPSRQTALAIAAVGGRVQSLRTLLELGADPNLSDNIGMTPLMYAVEVGNEGAVSALVHAGANVAAVNDAGKSAMSLARERNQEKMLPLLSGQ
jgi:ankyrin repeat protein